MGFYIPWLVDAARMAVAGTGKQVIVAPGAETRGHGGMRVAEIVVGHHTGTPDSAPGDYPSLRIVRDGRADLAGPLSNYGLGRSGNVYVIAAGCCWHAGASAFAGFSDLNDEAIGIEAESAGGGGWSNDQQLIYPRLVGACLHFLRRGVDRYASHRTVALPRGRKPDPVGIADDWMRQRAQAFLNAPASVPAEVITKKEEDDEMGYTVYVRGDKYPNIYCCTFDGKEAIRRYVESAEWGIATAAGKEALKVQQSFLDAIPKAPGSA